jgi:hypothetical protein
MLDVTSANRLRIVTGMGTTRNEQLAEYYLKAAGIAAIWIDRDGCIGAQDVATLQLEAGRVSYCCARGAHFVLAYRLQEWKRDVAADMRAIALKLEQLADAGGIGLTPHDVAIQRALGVVAAVNLLFAAMKDNGELRDINRAFKAARKVDA